MPLVVVCYSRRLQWAGSSVRVIRQREEEEVCPVANGIVDFLAAGPRNIGHLELISLNSYLLRVQHLMAHLHCHFLGSLAVL